MSEDSEQAQKPNKVDLAMYAENGDPVLSSLILISRLGVGVGVTLTVHGTIICGDLCPLGVYFEELAKRLRKASLPNNEGAPIVAAIANTWDEAAREGREHMEREQRGQKDANEPQVQPTYLQLNNAYILLPSGGTVNLGVWRGQVSSIDGFSLGRPEL